MSARVRNYVGIAIILALLAASYGIIKFAGTYSRSVEPGSYRSFTVSGEGKAAAVPDIAKLSFTVITEGGMDLGALQEENTAKANSAIEFVKGQGVNSEDIKTSQYSIEPRYQRYSCSSERAGEPCPPSEIVGYTVRQSVQVKVRDFSVLGTVLSGVVENGANTVSGPRFTIDDPTGVEMEAKAEAVENAKKKARWIAKAAGFSLGRLISIDEAYYPVRYERLMEEKAVPLGTGGSVPSIEPGTEEVISRVTLRYEIK